MAGIPQQPHSQPSIWAQMSYTPPRGPCSCKTSIVSTCPCYRFMIHPLKAHTSFDCDGCGHHASFHRMESREEEEVVRRWKTEMIGSEREEEDEGKERDRRRGIRTGMIEAGTEEMVEQFVTVAPKKKKRRMIGGVENDAVEDLEVYEEEMPVAGRRKRKGRG